MLLGSAMAGVDADGLGVFAWLVALSTVVATLPGHSVAASWSSRCATRFGYAVSIRPACAVAVRPSLGTLGQVFPSFPSGSSILQME